MTKSSIGIYAITNNKSKRTYIGSTVNFQRRWGEHRSTLTRGTHDNPHLQYSWNKHGETAFEFGVLEYLGNPEELHLAEQFWMDIYREEGKELYNCGFMARCPMLGRPRSEEVRRKISNSHKGKIFSEEHCRNISASRRGLPISKEHLQILVDLHKGKPLSEEHRRKIGEKNAKEYPSFIHHATGEIILAGRNLAILCRQQNLNRGHLGEVARGQRECSQGWSRYCEEVKDE